MSEDSLRIVVLSNKDFALDPADSFADDSARASRADVMAVVADVEKVLRERGAEVRLLTVRDLDVCAVVEEMRLLRPALVFNLCESLAGDSRNELVVPALLDLLGVPYTGSGPLALGLALDKPTAKRLLAAAGVPTPPALVIGGADDLGRLEAGALGKFPVICKLAREDASVGITSESVCRDLRQVRRRAAALLEEYRQPVLVERYVEGREIYVSVWGGADSETPEVLGRHEIDFTHMPAGRPWIVSYAGKWQPDSAEYRGSKPGPCGPLDAEQAARLDRAAIDAFRTLGLRDYGRIDFRLARDGTPYVIDVNPNCDLASDSGFPRAARLAGVSYDALVWRICELAWARHRARAESEAAGGKKKRDGAEKRKAGGSAASEDAARESRVVHAGGGRGRA